MTINTAIEISAQLSESEEKGKLINWRTLPWHLPVRGYDGNGNRIDGNQNEYWETRHAWELLANQNQLNSDANIAGKDGDLWVSKQLFEFAQAINWEIPSNYKNWTDIQIVENLRVSK